MSECTIAAALIADTRTLGIELKADSTGSRLLYRRVEAMPFTLAKLLREHKVAVLALLSATDEEVVWRVVVLRAQVPEGGAIGRPLVRPDSPTINTIRQCGMCGDPLAEGRRYRCILCQHALWLVLHATVEAIGQEEKQHGAA
jgi:hypothetical protein